MTPRERELSTRGRLAPNVPWGSVTEVVPTSESGEVGSEEQELLTRSPRLGVPVPAFAGRSIANLAAGLGVALGAPDGSPSAFLPTLAPDLDPFDGRRPEGPVVLLLVDGLGWLALRSSAQRVPAGTAERWVRRARPITSVFPTTTTVALTSLSTGAAPGQHGVVGHRVYLPKFGTVVEVLRMSPLGVSAAETLVGPEWTPAILSGVPSVFRRVNSGVAVSRERFERTGFTRLIYDGAAYVGYSTASDFALALVEVLSRPEPPALVFAYWDELDVGQHVRGPHPGLLDLEVERVGSILAFVARHLDPVRARNVSCIVTGDHGQVPMRADHQLVVDREPEILAQLARPPAGDRRATYFAARPGHLATLRELLSARLPPGGELLDLPTAVEEGLFGPPPYHPELADRLGDLLLLLPSPGGVSYTVPGSRPGGHPMRGAHGGLEAAELLVPLVRGTLTELSAAASPPPHLPMGPAAPEAT